MAEGKITMMGLRNTPTPSTATQAPIARVPDAISVPIVQPKPAKAPAKKQNEVVIAVYVDGQEMYLRYSVPLSSSLMSGQKSKEYLAHAFDEILSARFGKVAQL